MTPAQSHLPSFLANQLTETELETAVVYALPGPITAGAVLELPKMTVRMPHDSLIAFVDREPLANWGHSCRYILVDARTGEVSSVESRFPPFAQREIVGWRVVYRAPGVPDSALATPE